MLARVACSSSLSSSSLECNRYWSILFSSSSKFKLRGCNYVHTNAKLKAPQSKILSNNKTEAHTKPLATPTANTKLHPSTNKSPSQQPTTILQQINTTQAEHVTKQMPKSKEKSDKDTNTKKPNSQKKLENKASEEIVEEEEEAIIRYHPSPSVPPKRVPFIKFLERAKANKVSIIDVHADTPRKEFFEILKYLPGKTSLRDLTIRVKEISTAQAILLSKVLQTCENLQSFRIFSCNFYGPTGVQALNTLTKGILNSENLDYLSLETCKISSAGWDVIVEWMHKTTKLKTVDFKRTRMMGPHAEKLVEAIKTNENAVFEKLDWDQNMTNDEVVAVVLKELVGKEDIKNIRIKNYDIYRHNWNHTLLHVESKNEEKKDKIKAEIEEHRKALKEEFVPKPISTFHSNENEYINPKDTDRLQRKEKESKIMKAYEEFDYLKGATDREILKRIKLLKKRTQTKRGAVVKLK